MSAEDNKKPDRLQKDRKTAWDWSELFIKIFGALAIPISIFVLIVNVNQFNKQQSASAQMQATQLAASAARTLDQQRQATLDGYLKDMSDLLLMGHLRTTSDAQAIAQARTYTAVRYLDGPRKGTLVRFLWEAKLISGQHPIISLNGANLIGAIFAVGPLNFGKYAQLAPVVIVAPTHADLQDINLSGAILDGANLSGADLKGADLSGAIFNTKKEQSEDAQGNPLTLEPTQWPQGFHPQGAICDDC